MKIKIIALLLLISFSVPAKLKKHPKKRIITEQSDPVIELIAKQLGNSEIEKKVIQRLKKRKDTFPSDATEINLSFSAPLKKLFNAQFTVQYAPIETNKSIISFDLTEAQKKQFLRSLFKKTAIALHNLTNKLSLSNKAAFKLQEAIGPVVNALHSPIETLTIKFPSKINSVVNFESLSGTIHIDHGTLFASPIGKISLEMVQQPFSLEHPHKSMVHLANLLAARILKNGMKRADPFGRTFNEENRKTVKAFAKA